MNELLKVIEEYKIFNYLVPGVITTYLLGDGSFFEKIQNINLFAAFFIYYFVGFTISRLGSLIIGPVLKRSGVVKFEDYTKFLVAARRDNKIELLSQENNSYRTYIAVFAVVLIVNTIVRIFDNDVLRTRESLLFLSAMGSLLMLMIFSYRKQTTFITKRIKHSSKQ